MKVLLCVFLIFGTYSLDVPSGDSLALAYLERTGILYDRSEYDSLPYYYETAGGIFERLGMPGYRARCLLGMVDYYRMMKRQSEALSAMDLAGSYIESRIGRETVSWADALLIRAKLYSDLNRNRESISDLKECLVLQHRLGMPPDKTARVYNVLGVNYYILGDIDSAETNYRKSLEQYAMISPEPSAEKGMLLFNLGLVYNRYGDYESWADYTLRGIENNISLFGPDFPELATNYSSLSSYFIRTGLFDSASYYLDRAESIMVKSFGEDYPDLSFLHINRARIYRYEGNYQASLEYYLQALRIVESQEIPDAFRSYSLYINIGQLYEAMGEYGTAREYFSRLLEAEGKIHPSRMASCYYNLARINIHLGNYRESERYFRKLFAIRREYFSPIHPQYSYDYEAYAVLMDSLDRPDDAETWYRKSLDIALKNYGRFHNRTSNILYTLGGHYQLAGDPERALERYQEAIRALVPEYRVTDPDRNPDPQEVPDLLLYLRILKHKAGILDEMADRAGKGSRSLDFTKAAFHAYLGSVQVIELLRNSYLNDEGKLYLSEHERDSYEKGVRSAFRCFELSGDREYLVHAFRMAEGSKYATLRSVLQREEALELSGIPESLLERESALKKQLSAYQGLLMERMEDTLPDMAEVQKYRDETFRLKNRISGIHRTLESDYPDYYELLYLQRTEDPASIGRRLNRKEKIIEYFLTKDDLYIFEIGRRGFSCRRQPFDSSLVADLGMVQEYVSGTSIYNTVQDHHHAFIGAASRLYRILIPESGSYRDLIIIPEGVLSYFPFDVLITEPVDSFSGLFSQVPFLIRSHNIRYGYSAALMDRKTNMNPGTIHRFLGFAPGYLGVQGDGTGAGNHREIRIDRKNLPPLPGSIDEVAGIGNLLGGRYFTGPDASEGKFKELAGEGHIIHLATHAFLDDRDPLRSTLVFSWDSTDAEDGLLRVYELFNMDLNARIVVLSACNTGAGELLGGEGIMSLARAFFYAGVPNIVMTLWTISDRQGYELMLSFYRYLSRGRSAESALRRAKIEYLGNAPPVYQHPRYWSGYILLGNPGSLMLPWYYRHFLWIALVVLALLSGFLVLRKFRAKR